MAKYTITPKTVAESHYVASGNTLDGATTSQVIESFLPVMFNFTYPIWDEKYREVLNRKILTHYYMEEIGLETWNLFIYYLEMWLNENMPYYNTLYALGKEMGNVFQATGKKNDQFNRDNVHSKNVTTDNNQSRKNTGTQTKKKEYNSSVKDEGEKGEKGTEWSSDRDIGSNASDYKNDNYASFANKRESDMSYPASNTRTNSGNDTDTRTDDLSQIDTLHGTETDRQSIVDDELRVITTMQETNDKVGTYVKLIEYYRDIDQKIIEALQELFMKVW